MLLKGSRLFKQIKLTVAFLNNGKEKYLFMQRLELQIQLRRSLNIYHFQGIPTEN